MEAPSCYMDWGSHVTGRSPLPCLLMALPLPLIQQSAISHTQRHRQTVSSCYLLLLAVLVDEEARRRQHRRLANRTMDISHIARVNVETWDVNICLANTRFTPTEIMAIYSHLRLPAIIRLPNRSIETGPNALAMLLHRIALPGRHLEQTWIFGRERSVCGRIERHVRKFIMDHWIHLLTWNPRRLTPRRLEDFAAGLEETKDCPLDNCVGFIDGCVWKVCRPGIDQRLFYNGHKRSHAIKFQAVTTPDGITVDLSPACFGNRHDTAMFWATGISHRIQMYAKGYGGRQMMLYGDQGYPNTDVIVTPFAGGVNHLQPHQRRFNDLMSRCRVGVEHEFGRVRNLERLTQYEDNLKLRLSDCDAIYRVATFIKNLLVCCHRGPNLPVLAPPTLEEYLGG